MKINDRYTDKTIIKNLNEKILLLSIIGGLEALKEDAVTVDELEKFIFSPYISELLKKNGFNKQIIELIDEGCLLEDFLSLLPREMPKEIDDMKKKAIMLLKNYNEYSQYKWLIE